LIARLALALVEWATAAYAVALAASATRPADLIAADFLTIAAASIRSIAISRAAGRRFDAAFAPLRAVPPSNDIGGL